MPDFSKITTFIFDVDGVLTDGTVQSFASGEHARRFYVKDGYAIEKAIQAGYHVFVISGGFEEGVRKRLEFLGIKNFYLGVRNKVEIFDSIIDIHSIDRGSILYMGDDVPDLKVLHMAGISCCPRDAAQDVRSVCDYISPFDGGRGAVRDVIEIVMKQQNTWQADMW